jgi:hypothetical protein
LGKREKTKKKSLFSALLKREKIGLYLQDSPSQSFPYTHMISL